MYADKNTPCWLVSISLRDINGALKISNCKQWKELESITLLSCDFRKALKFQLFTNKILKAKNKGYTAAFTIGSIICKEVIRHVT